MSLVVPVYWAPDSLGDCWRAARESGFSILDLESFATLERIPSWSWSELVRITAMAEWWIRPQFTEQRETSKVIYHLAINWNGYSWRHSLPLPELFDANIRGTHNLLEAARSRKINHFLVSSSAAVYGETQRTFSSRDRSLLRGMVNEESACRPYLWDGDPGPAYAILKLAIENLCLMYHHTYALPVTVFRIEYVFTNMEQFRDGANVQVDDVVRAFSIATLNKRSYGQVFNLAYPVPYMSIRKISRMLGWKPESTLNFLRSR